MQAKKKVRTYGTVPYLAVSVGEDLTQAVPVLDELFPLSLNLGHHLAAAHHVTQHLVREHPPHISAKQPNLLVKQYGTYSTGTVPTYGRYLMVFMEPTDQGIQIKTNIGRF